MLVIAVSSHVGASSVGLSIMTPALHACGVEVLSAPTVVLGRHPGWGAPGGGPVDDAAFAGVLEGLCAHPDAARASWIVSGYCASPAQVAAIAALVDRLKAENAALRYLCDPVMGDAPKGLYVPSDVAEALAEYLVPRADVLTPNVWEAEWLTGCAITSPVHAREAGRVLLDRASPGAACAITSVRQPLEPGRLGAALIRGEDAWFAHGPVRSAPGGGAGDLFAALLTAHWGRKGGLVSALAHAVGALDAVLSAAEGAAELPRAGLAPILQNAAPAPIMEIAHV